MARTKKFLFPLLLLLISALPLPADTPADTETGEDLAVSLMIVGPGIPLYVWWGHIGLIVENEKEGWSYFYDFGNFSFEEDHFYRNFAMGRLYYLKIKSRTDSYLRYLTWFDRRVTIYNLNLTPEERKTIYEGLEEGRQAGEQDLSVPSLRRQLLHPDKGCPGRRHGGGAEGGDKGIRPVLSGPGQPFCTPLLALLPAELPAGTLSG